jgi:hypothetical protein
MTKVCKTCKEEKELYCFSPQTQDGKTTFRTQCKPCRSNANKHQANLWNKENRAKIKEDKEAEGRRRQTILKKRREEYKNYLRSKDGGE